MSSSGKMMLMIINILKFIGKLEEESKYNIKLSETGSEISSMADDCTSGQVGIEQLRIAEELKKILGL